jgi:hypothetical protein
MDYEKKYKELAGKIKKAYLYAQTDSTKAVLEDIMPELKESEDERIRKNCIHFLELQKTHHAATFEIEECIAWLEKQGETFTKKDVDDAYLKGISDAKNELEKQGEQETDEWKEGNIIRHGGILALVIKGRRAMKSNGEIFTVQYPDEWVKAAPNEIEHFLDEFEKQGETFTKKRS